MSPDKQMQVIVRMLWFMPNEEGEDVLQSLMQVFLVGNKPRTYQLNAGLLARNLLMVWC